MPHRSSGITPGLGQFRKVCRTQTALKRVPFDSCLISAFLGKKHVAADLCPIFLTSNPKSLFYNAPHSNKWLYSVPFEQPLTVTYPTATDNEALNGQSITISGAGTLTLPPHCEAQVGGEILTSRLVGETHIQTNNNIHIFMPNLHPIWDSVLNNSTHMRKYLDIVSNVQTTAAALPPLLLSMKNLLNTPDGKSMSHLTELHRFIDMSLDNVADFNSDLLTTNSVSATSPFRGLLLILIFLYRFYLFKLQRRERGEASIPLNSS